MCSIPRVGVSIPVYNDAQSLKTCVESVQNQTLKDLEIWIVDDGSTDGSGAIADEIATKDDRVHVLHQNNKGNYAARLAGILKITAKYFSSVDADDIIEPKMLEEMLDLAEHEDLDVVECDLSITQKSSGETVVYRNATTTFEKVILPVFVEGNGFSCVCGKIYRKTLLDNTACRQSILEEKDSRIALFDDALFNIQIMHAVKSYGYIHKPFYTYQISGLSTVRNFKAFNINGFQKVVDVRKRIAKYYGIESNDVRLSDWTINNMVNLILLASYAKSSNKRENAKNVGDLLQLDVLTKALENVKNKNSINGKAIVLSIFRHLPSSFVSWILSIAWRFTHK